MKTNTTIRLWTVLILVSSFVSNGYATIFHNCEDLEPETIFCQDLDNERMVNYAFRKFFPFSICSPSFQEKREYTDDFSNVDDCGTGGYILRNWVISDDCGDTLRCTQRANVLLTRYADECLFLGSTVDCVGEINSETGRGGQYPGQVCVSRTDFIYEFEDDYSLLETEGVINRQWEISYPCGVLGGCSYKIKVQNIPIINTCELNSTSFSCEETDLIEELANWNQSNLDQLKTCSFSDCAELTITSDFDEDNIIGCEQIDSIVVTYMVANGYLSPVIQKTTAIVNPTTNTNDCSNISVSSNDNELTIANLHAPNTIVQVFDANWQRVFRCAAACSETETIPNVIAGAIYHIDLQLYDEQWKPICKDKRDIEISYNTSPCGTSICDGDVDLFTQEEVDAFCGCEVIEGDLNIGNGSDNPSSIYSIQNLRGLRKVNGIVSIVETSLQDLEGLEDLLTIGGSLGISDNPQLVNLQSISKLSSIGQNLFIGSNPALQNLDGLEGLISVENLIYFRNNISLSSINGLRVIKSFKKITLEDCPIESIQNLGNSRIENLDHLAIVNCDELINVDGLEHLQKVNNITISGNDKLENIDGLMNIKYVYDDLKIYSNAVLNNCCAIQHLLDDDLENGVVENGNIEIQENLELCNAPTVILEQCTEITETINTCENIQIATENNQIEISGLTAAIEIVRVLDKQYKLLYECIATCDNKQVTGVFPDGKYIVDIQIYDEAWKFICTEQQTVVLGEANNLTTDFCEEVRIEASSSNITLSNIVAPISIIKVFSPTWKLLYNCTATCESDIQIPISVEGTYHIDIQSYSTNWQPICKSKEDIVITNESLKRVINQKIVLPIEPMIYPNPAKHEVFIELSSLKGQASRLILYNQFAQLVWEENINQSLDINRIDLSRFESGLYFLNIQVEDAQTITKKILISK